MRRPCCHTFLPFILKFLNFLQTFTEISMIIYSVFMLNQWSNRSKPPPPSSPPPSPDYVHSFLSNFHAIVISDHATALNYAANIVSGFDDGLGLRSPALPTPW
ncbi:hypothetical protein U1Q18_039287 [Sarracenia purpurea var. burkii]